MQISEKTEEKQRNNTTRRPRRQKPTPKDCRHLGAALEHEPGFGYRVSCPGCGYIPPGAVQTASAAVRAFDRGIRTMKWWKGVRVG